MTDVGLLHAHLRGEHAAEAAEGCPVCTRTGPTATVSAPVSRPASVDTVPPTGRLCGCGCGHPVKRRFLPGHDAKLKGRLVREARDGSTDAMAELRRYGWEHFV